MTSENRIPTNLRTLLILEVIGNSEKAMTATEINSRIGLPKQTVHRLVATLEAEGFLMRDADGKHYRPGRRLRMMGAGLLHGSRFHIVRHQILKEVAAQVKEAVNYVIPEETGMHYIDRVDTDWPFRIQLPVGTNVPFHCTASGKAFLSSMSKSVRERFVAGIKLNALTKDTHTTPEALLADLRVCAKRGYTLDNEEFMEGMIAIAVPVTDPEGRYVASLAFHGPSQRLDIEGLVGKREVLLDGARRLQVALFS